MGCLEAPKVLLKCQTWNHHPVHHSFTPLSPPHASLGILSCPSSLQPHSSSVACTSITTIVHPRKYVSNTAIAGLTPPKLHRHSNIWNRGRQVHCSPDHCQFITEFLVYHSNHVRPSFLTSSWSLWQIQDGNPPHDKINDPPKLFFWSAELPRLEDGEG